MFAVGSFTKISWGGTTYSRNNVFSFSATSPFKVTGWNPDVNGEVDSIALTADCQHAYIGGSFTQAGGAAAHNIAELRTYANTLVKGWAHSANNPVDTSLTAANFRRSTG